MGCNCKSGQQQQRPKVIIDNGEIKNPSKPNYSREEIQRAINYIRGITNSPQERKWVIQFHNQHFSEQLIPSCSTCWERVNTRIEHLNQKLTFYEEYISRTI